MRKRRRRKDGRIYWMREREKEREEVSEQRDAELPFIVANCDRSRETEKGMEDRKRKSKRGRDASSFAQRTMNGCDETLHPIASYRATT